MKNQRNVQTQLFDIDTSINPTVTLSEFQFDQEIICKVINSVNLETSTTIQDDCACFIKKPLVIEI